MVPNIASSAELSSWLVLSQYAFVLIQVVGIVGFAYIVVRRLAPMLGAERDFRFDRPLQRFEKVLQFWLGQWRHPRYPAAGILHILIFSGFIILAARSFTLLVIGMPSAVAPRASRALLSQWYAWITDYAATVVFICMIVAAVRRIVFKPARYAVPPRYGKGHPADAIFLLALIAVLMFADSLFAASEATTAQAGSQALAVFSLAWLLKLIDRHGIRSIALGHSYWRIHPARIGFLLPALLSAVRHSVPRGDVAVQRVLRQAGSRHRQAGEVGSRR